MNIESSFREFDEALWKAHLAKAPHITAALAKRFNVEGAEYAATYGFTTLADGTSAVWAEGNEIFRLLDYTTTEESNLEDMVGNKYLHYDKLDPPRTVTIYGIGSDIADSLCLNENYRVLEFEATAEELPLLCAIAEHKIACDIYTNYDKQVIEAQLAAFVL